MRHLTWFYVETVLYITFLSSFILAICTAGQYNLNKIAETRLRTILTLICYLQSFLKPKKRARLPLLTLTFALLFFYFLRPAFGHGCLGHPQSLEYFSLRLLLLTHFGESPVCENSFPPIFWLEDICKKIYIILGNFNFLMKKI